MWRGFFFTLFAVCLIPTTTHADTWLLVPKSATISRYNSSGGNWDIYFVTAPEPFLKISVYDKDGAQVDFGQTEFNRDTYQPTWNQEIVNVEEGDRIKIEVWDKDLRYDDLIGKSDVTLTKQMIRERRITVRFGQVRDLRFELRPGS